MNIYIYITIKHPRCIFLTRNTEILDIEIVYQVVWNLCGLKLQICLGMSIHVSKLDVTLACS